MEGRRFGSGLAREEDDRTNGNRVAEDHGKYTVHCDVEVSDRENAQVRD